MSEEVSFVRLMADERDALKAENKRLRELLTEVLGEGDQRYHATIEKYVCQHCGEICETEFCQEEDCPGRKARAALKGKP